MYNALILPTRDGNLKLDLDRHFVTSGFDPTYKGWKPLKKGLECREIEVRFDPTYKGWKLLVVGQVSSSYHPL